jgi:hypothetical protein
VASTFVAASGAGVAMVATGSVCPAVAEANGSEGAGSDGGGGGGCKEGIVRYGVAAAGEGGCEGSNLLAHLG